MAVRCLYPDFFGFLDTLEEEEKQPLSRWERFERLYFDKHSEILSNLWFRCQTYSRDDIRERVAAVKRGDYGQLRSALLRYDLPGATEAVLERCAGLAGPVPSDVYLLVGFFSPDAFVADFGGGPSICVGLERFRTFGHYPVLLSHEYCHLLAAARTGRPAGDVAHEAVGEGIAVYFSRLAFPDAGEHACLFMEERRFRDLLSRYPGAREAAEELGKGRESGGEARRLWPHREFYFLGYMLVREYVERTGVRAIGELIERRGDISVDFGLR
jgi:hypothetical protein